MIKRLFSPYENDSEQDLALEIQSHLDLEAEEACERSLSPGEANYAALRKFGNTSLVKEDVRATWGWTRTEQFLQDLRYGLRQVRRNPGFGAIAVLSLALGIGANTAIFGLIDLVMIQLIAARHPEELVFVNTAGTAGLDGPPYPCFELFRDHAKSFESVAAFSHSSMEVVLDGQRELARGIWVSGKFYEMLGVQPLVGRTLSASDDQVLGKGGAEGAFIVISRTYWQQRFGGDPHVIGRAIRMYDYTVTIAGVLPSEAMTLETGQPIDLAAPMMLSDPAKMRDRSSLWLTLVARLRPGVTVEHARAESQTLLASYMTDAGVLPANRSRLFDHIELRPAAHGLNVLRNQFANPLTALMVLASLVLLAACINVANLMLARATARQKELAVRLAIGAGRARLIRQTLTEAFVLVGAGAAIGIFLARQGQAVLAAFLAAGRNQVALNLSLNGHILLFAVSVAAVTGLTFGILPALRSANADPVAGLQSGSRAATGNRVSTRIGQVLVVAQVALSMVLLAGAGLFIRSLRQLQAVDLGFSREGILTMEVTPERHLFGTPEWLTVQTEIVNRVRRLPGVRAASWATYSPFSGRGRAAVLRMPGFTPREETDKDIHLAAVSPHYFDTYNLPLMLGHDFSERDTNSSPRVAIINETAARFYFPTSNPIGRKVQFANYATRSTDFIYEIIGVVKDAKHDNMREPPSRFIYLPITQSVDRINRLALSVHCSGDALQLAAPVRQEVQAARRTLMITNVSTIDRQVQQSLFRERLVSSLSALFGVAALVLACIGLYGILAYAVTRRTNEIGVRMALGATAREIVRLVLREAVILTGVGILIGSPIMLALRRITSTLLYGVNVWDLPALGGAILLLLAFGIISGIVPARRASKMDPMTALRWE